MSYIAMNRFMIRIGSEETFETMWRERESRLKEVSGFQEFRLLKGPAGTHEGEDYRLYSSHVVWGSEADFVAWTKSQHFRDAHKNAGDTNARAAFIGAPKFEGFETVLHED
ncbi:MAG: antibiotic biosynthesis monooxygenase [Pseudomonadota bacterium]